MTTRGVTVYATETRWALAVNFGEPGGTADWLLVGRFCWPGGARDDQNVRTFRTRKLAREAMRKLTSYSAEVRPVKVKVAIVGEVTR